MRLRYDGLFAVSASESHLTVSQADEARCRAAGELLMRLNKGGARGSQTKASGETRRHPSPSLEEPCDDALPASLATPESIPPNTPFGVPMYPVFGPERDCAPLTAEDSKDVDRGRTESRRRLAKGLYAGADDLVSALLRGTSGSRTSERPVRRPQDEALEALIKVAFQASLLQEEQRPLRFRLAYLSRKEAQRYGSQKIAILTFAKPRPLEVSELTRLAPAVDSFTAVLLVQDSGAAASAPYFELWGVMAFDSDRPYVDQPPHKAWSGPDALVVVSNAPGNVLVSRGSTPLFELRDGEVLELDHHGVGNTLSVGDVQLFSRAMATVDRAVARCFGRSEPPESRRMDGESFNCEYAYVLLLRRLIADCARHRHGACLMFVPRSRVKDIQLREVVSVKYRLSTPAVTDALVFQEAMATWREQTEMFGKDPSLADADGAFMERPRFSERIIKNEFVARARAATPRWKTVKLRKADPWPENQTLDGIIETYIATVARLSQADGAVLLTSTLSCLGFGCEGPLRAGRCRHVFDVVRGKSIAIDSYGTRHRSAFRFCDQVAGSAAIVLSQDGSVKFVTKGCRNVEFIELEAPYVAHGYQSW